MHKIFLIDEDYVKSCHSYSALSGSVSLNHMLIVFRIPLYYRK